MAENEKSTTVKSVFKSGESTTTEREFTNKWIRLTAQILYLQLVLFAVFYEMSSTLPYCHLAELVYITALHSNFDYTVLLVFKQLVCLVDF